MPEALREYYSSTMLTKLQGMGALTILDASTGEPLQDSNLDVLSNRSVIKTLPYNPENESQISATRASENDNLPQGMDTELAAQITELRAREAVFGIRSEDFVNVLMDKAGLHKEEETQPPEAVEDLAAESSEPDVEGTEPTAGAEVDRSTEAKAIPTEAITQADNEANEQDIGGATGEEDVEKAKAILAIARQAFIYQANNGQLVRDADVVSAHGHHYNLSYHEPTEAFIVSGTNKNSLSIIGAEEDEGFKIYGVSQLEDADIERFNTTSQYLEGKSFHSDQPIGEAITSQSIDSTTALDATNRSSGKIAGSEFVRQALRGIVIDIPENGLSAKQQFQAWLKAEEYTPNNRSDMDKQQDRIAREIVLNVRSFIPYALRENKATNNGKVISGAGKSYSFEISTSPDKYLHVLNLRTKGEIRLVDGILKASGMQNEDLQNWQVLGKLNQKFAAKQIEA